ncbi:hypothetical protein DENSPDRAFT_851492 [Dentipellis sp. KUC8613]|nr:hypothetical protein DENSPDRAFT_851492 [Dentipellis sp. KUC8613]
MKRRHSDEHESVPPSRSSPSESSSHGEGGMADTETDAGPSQSDAGPSGGGDSAPLPPPPPAKKKRTRTLTTPHQSAVLHALLAQSRFPTTAMREEVGRSIGLSARKVQNQRQKARRPRSQSAAAPLTRPPQYGAFSNDPSAPSAAMGHMPQGSVPGPSRLHGARAGYYPEPPPYPRATYSGATPGVPLTGPGMPGSAGPYVSRFPQEQLPPLGPPPSGFDPRQGYAEQWSPPSYPEGPSTSQGYGTTGERFAPRGRSASRASQRGLGINLPPIVTDRGRASSSAFPPPLSAPLRRLDEPSPSAYVPPMDPGPRSPAAHRIASHSGSFHGPLHSSRTLPPLTPLHIPPTYTPPASQWASAAFSASPHTASGPSPVAPLPIRSLHSAQSGASPGAWPYTSPIAPAPASSALREATPVPQARSPSPRPPPRRARFDPVRAAQDENASGGSGSGSGSGTPTQRTPPAGGSHL